MEHFGRHSFKSCIERTFFIFPFLIPIRFIPALSLTRFTSVSRHQLPIPNSQLPAVSTALSPVPRPQLSFDPVVNQKTTKLLHPHARICNCFSLARGPYAPDNPHVRIIRGINDMAKKTSGTELFIVDNSDQDLMARFFPKDIREARKAAALAQSLRAKLEGQKQIKALEANRNRKRRELFDAQDAIDVQRDELIDKIEKQMQHTAETSPLFRIRWRVN